MKVVLIGSGNVSTHLAGIISGKHKIVQIYNRSSSGKKLALKFNCSFTSKVSDIFQDADIYIVAIPDKSIEPFLKKITFNPKLIVHTSGSTALNVFPVHMKNFGVLYPLQTFSESKKKPPAEIPICIEANTKKGKLQIKSFAKTISNKVTELSTEQRQIVHLAAVLVNNYTNHLYKLAKNILKTKNISFEILKPLIVETTEKIIYGQPEKMQTGPAIRGDKSTIIRHLKLLEKDKSLKNIYKLFADSIQKEYKSGK